MSKGSSRKARTALANRQRNPEAWGGMPVAIAKAGKNRVIALLPKRHGGKRRNA